MIISESCFYLVMIFNFVILFEHYYTREVVIFTLSLLLSFQIHLNSILKISYFYHIKCLYCSHFLSTLLFLPQHIIFFCKILLQEFSPICHSFSHYLFQKKVYLLYQILLQLILLEIILESMIVQVHFYTQSKGFLAAGSSG